MKERSIKALQGDVDKHIHQFKEGYFQPLSMLARLTEEIGELAREINHTYGEKQKKPNEKENCIANELGDIMFILFCFANSLGIDLEKAFDEVMNKYKTRDYHRWTRIKN